MINSINNCKTPQLGFTSERLAKVTLRKTDENKTPVTAYFTKLDRENSPEDKKAIETCEKKWNDQLLEFLFFSKDLYAIELEKGKTLADKIVTIAGTNSFINNRNGSPPFLMMETLATNPKYRHANEEREIKGGGTVMMAMLSKLTKELGLEAVVLSSNDDALPFYEDEVKMKESDKEFDSLEIEKKGMDDFIKEVESEYELGQIDTGKL